LGVFGVGLGRLSRLEVRRSWACLASWAASVLGVFGVLGGVSIGRLWRLGRRRCWASLVSWAASVLFVFGGVSIGRLRHLGLGRLWWVFRRLGARRSWSSLSVLVLASSWASGCLASLSLWCLGRLWSLERLLACWPSLASLASLYSWVLGVCLNYLLHSKLLAKTHRFCRLLDQCFPTFLMPRTPWTDC
jgi:hypothetical protein